MTLADKILAFNSSLALDDGILPNGIKAMNPFKGEHASIIEKATTAFYKKYYSDSNSRKLIIGINPGRLGAGLTGIPFTDTKRLQAECGINIADIHSHEPSSVFVYHVIKAFGGPHQFYSQFYINSVCPLGFVKKSDTSKMINFNYYDNKALENAVKPFIISTLKQQIAMGMDIDKVFCLGTGKNYKFLKELNNTEKLFGQIVPLSHPRFVMQYRNKQMQNYIDSYLSAFRM